MMSNACVIHCHRAFALATSARDLKAKQAAKADKRNEEAMVCVHGFLIRFGGLGSLLCSSDRWVRASSFSCRPVLQD